MRCTEAVHAGVNGIELVMRLLLRLANGFRSAAPTELFESRFHEGLDGLSHLGHIFGLVGFVCSRLRH